MLLSCLLVILYETVRKLSQAFLMLSVTTWLTFTLGGSSAGYTRVFDVIIGALIAFVMFLFSQHGIVKYYVKISIVGQNDQLYFASVNQ